MDFRAWNRANGSGLYDSPELAGKAATAAAKSQFMGSLARGGRLSRYPKSGPFALAMPVYRHEVSASATDLMPRRQDASSRCSDDFDAVFPTRPSDSSPRFASASSSSSWLVRRGAADDSESALMSSVQQQFQSHAGRRSTPRLTSCAR